MSTLLPDPPEFVAFKASARRCHEARKIADARSMIIGSRIHDRDLQNAVLLLGSWLKRQPQDVRDYALAPASPQTVRIGGTRER